MAIRHLELRGARGGARRVGPRLIALVLLWPAITFGAIDPPPTSVQLAAAISETHRSARARGVFHQQTVGVSLVAGQAWLASSPDGQGGLCTDDQATLVIERAGREHLRWQHRFSSDDRRSVVCTPPQLLGPLDAGDYRLTLTLEDLYPHTYSSRPYYLIIMPAPVPTSMAPASVRPRPSQPASVLVTPRLAASSRTPASAALPSPHVVTGATPAAHVEEVAADPSAATAGETANFYLVLAALVALALLPVCVG